MLHEFRQTMGVGGLRAINQYLVGRLLRRTGLQPHAVALMDATDLPGGVQRLQKKIPATTPPRTRRWADARSRPARAVGLSATRNIRCGCGCPPGIRR